MSPHRIAHTLPLLLRGPHDLPMANACLASLAAAEPGARLVVCNQGYLPTPELSAWLRSFALDTVVVGSGQNVGIAAGRSACFQWLWRHEPPQYLSEIHLDMLFPPGWSAELAAFLDANPDEPLVAPGILTANGELAPDVRRVVVLEAAWWEQSAAIQGSLRQWREPRAVQAFVHPVLHRSEALRAIGGYDTRFLRGMQGYEDDSLLLGHRLRLGIARDWRPKCWLGARVFHATLAQRMTVGNLAQSVVVNLNGLLAQYGVVGLEQLAALYPANGEFRQLADRIVADLAAVDAHSP
ncbi:MAG: hypothetical protein U1F60_09340 [Planctomycetota bacterium]